MRLFRSIQLAVALGIAIPLFAATTQPADLGVKPPDGAIVLFNGSSLDAWAPFTATKPTITDGAMIVAGGNLVTKQSFGDFKLHVEFNCPDLPKEITGQKRSNSGVYLHDRYEIQILGHLTDKLPDEHEVGAIYSIKAPSRNALRADGTWQSFDIAFRAPRFDAGGKKVENAKVSVMQNGVVIHTDVSIDKPQGGARGDEAPTGPIRLQDKGHKIAFRNIWIVPEKSN